MPAKDHRAENEELIPGLHNPDTEQRFGEEFKKAQEEIELIQAATPDFDIDAFLAGKQTPLFFGSALNNFGVQEVLDALVEMAPAPGPRESVQRVVEPTEPKFTGMVFKVQANMDPAHRDRLFVRLAPVTSLVACAYAWHAPQRNRPNNRFFYATSWLVDEGLRGILAFPTTGIKLGDAHWRGNLNHWLTFFAPELSDSEVKDPLRTRARYFNPTRRRGCHSGLPPLFSQW